MEHKEFVQLCFDKACFHAGLTKKRRRVPDDIRVPFRVTNHQQRNYFWRIINSRQPPVTHISVSLDEILAGQRLVNREIVKEKQRPGTNTSEVRVVQIDGILFLKEGHHTLTAKYRAGMRRLCLPFQDYDAQ
jgi:hypothetical protein